MKTAVLCGFTLLAIEPLFAQTNPQPGADDPNKTVTLTGCVAGGADERAITLSNALIVPGTPQPGQLDQTPSDLPPTSSTATQPVDPTLPPPTAAPVQPPTSSPTGTSGTKTPPPTATGATGMVTGTAPAGSSGSSITGYRLSGADMQPWIGKRVQIIGTFAPVAPSAGSQSAATSGAGTPAVREFRVQTVQPATGVCPKH